MGFAEDALPHTQFEIDPNFREAFRSVLRGTAHCERIGQVEDFNRLSLRRARGASYCFLIYVPMASRAREVAFETTQPDAEKIYYRLTVLDPAKNCRVSLLRGPERSRDMASSSTGRLRWEAPRNSTT